MERDDDTVAAWARSGAMALTGRAAGPALGAPAGFVGRVRAVETAVHSGTGRVGTPVDIDALALLGERAALAGFQRRGDRSCGGASRLLPAGDGWLAVSMARPSDFELLPAWLGITPSSAEDNWDGIARAVAARDTDGLLGEASLLGLPVAALPTMAWDRSQVPVGSAIVGSAPPVGMAELLVVDLSSLWAGPLCAQLLGFAGARVIKVESTSRPDGARFGPAAFFDLLHAGHESVAVDFTTAPGRDALRYVIDQADIVIEASRPRALEQLGINAEVVLRSGRLRVWLSITGYGRTGPTALRVAFGDDGAAAGGLVVWDESGPCFLADAVADPLTGLVATAAVLESIAAGGRWLLDVSLHGVAAHFAGDAAVRRESALSADPDGTVATEHGRVTVAPPRARRPGGVAAPLGCHTEAVLAEFRQARR